MQKWQSWFCYSVGVVVTLCFVTAFVMDQMDHRDVPTSMYALMGIVAGGVFGIPAIRGRY